MSPPTLSLIDHGHETRRRLIVAATEVFIANGFAHGSMREVCRKAGANVAAVNYHFRDKNGLYQAVLESAYSDLYQRHPLPDNPDLTPAERIAGYIRAFIFRIVDGSQKQLLWQLMLREMENPTAALDAMVEKMIKPQMEYLRLAVAAYTGRSPDDLAVQRACQCITGQCLHYRQNDCVVKRLNVELALKPENAEEIIQAIGSFSMAGLNSLRTP